MTTPTADLIAEQKKRARSERRREAERTIRLSCWKAIVEDARREIAYLDDLDAQADEIWRLREKLEQVTAQRDDALAKLEAARLGM